MLHESFGGFVVRGEPDECGLPLAHGGQGRLEAQSATLQVAGDGGVCHDGAQQVVGDDVHEQFPVDHFRGFAAQDVHAQRGFDVAQAQFAHPAHAVEPGEVFGGELRFIEQGSDDHDGAGAESGNVDMGISGHLT